MRSTAGRWARWLLVGFAASVAAEGCTEVTPAVASHDGSADDEYASDAAASSSSGSGSGSSMSSGSGGGSGGGSTVDSSASDTGGVDGTTDSGSGKDSTTADSPSADSSQGDSTQAVDSPADSNQLDVNEASTCTGLLHSAVNWPVPSGASWIIAPDLDGDGKPDLAVTTVQSNGGLLAVLLNNGDGTMKSTVTYDSGADPSLLCAGDLNGDTLPDLVVANSGWPGGGDNGAIDVFLGTGGGAFQPALANTGLDCPYGVALSDFDGDGKPDIVATAGGAGCSGYGNGGTYLLLGKGDGTLSTPTLLTHGSLPGQIATSDLNGDKKVDIVVGDGALGLTVFLGKGNGSFSAPSYYGSASGAALIADLNLDQIPDLAGSGYVLLGKGDGTFGSALTTPTSGWMDMGDIDRDGKPDLVMINGVALGNGDGTFQMPTPFTAGSRPFSVAVQDFDSNGSPDVAVTNFDGANLSVLLNCK